MTASPERNTRFAAFTEGAPVLESALFKTLVFGTGMPGAGALQAHPGVVVELDLTAADSPDSPPAVAVGEPAQRFVADRVEKFQLAGMGDKVFGVDREGTRDKAGHRPERDDCLIFLHGRIHSPLTGRLGGERRGGGRLSGVGGGFGGRFNLWPSAFRDFSDGLGPRASGFFMYNSDSSFLYGRCDGNGRFRMTFRFV